MCSDCEKKFAPLLEELAKYRAMVTEDDHGNEYAIVCHYKNKMCEMESELTRVKKSNEIMREAIKVVDYTNRSRGYPIPKEWDEVAQVCKEALSRAEQVEKGVEAKRDEVGEK